MNIFQRKIEEWLSRPVPDRASNTCYGMPFHLATDIGLHRKINQDRVAALSIAEPLGGYPLLALAVSDGMGGMRDGEKCAALAISSFFYFLAQHRMKEVSGLLKEAILYSNEMVNKDYGGCGGATFSAVVLAYGNKAYLVNVGDSRIYSYGAIDDVKRLTVDDSLMEAVGGYGRELLQFVGMGDGLQAHISEMEILDQKFVITTDGAHSLESKTFNSILNNSTDIKSAAERILAVSRWCGGHDNATVAILDMLPAYKKIYEEGGGVQLWDPFGNLTTMWLRHNELSIDRRGRAQEEKQNKKEEKPQKEKEGGGGRKAKRSSKVSKESVKKEAQLNIEIVPAEESGKDDEKK